VYLAKLGVPFRIIDKNAGPGQQSRAMAVQARTLEFYRQLGFADEVISAGIKIDEIHLWEQGREVSNFRFGDLGDSISPHAYALSYPQDEHERFLGIKLRELGVTIEWETELVDLAQDENGVQVSLRSKSGDEAQSFAYVCGCDGARSEVRQKLGLEFSGGTYDQVFYVADVKAEGVTVNGGLNGCLGTNSFSIVFPIRTTGMSRLIGVIPEGLGDPMEVTFEQIKPIVEELVNIKVESLNWYSTYHVHHRVAESFQQGSVFLCGDAGHIHSPAGGQGMNTGIGDAVNLAWKLAAVVQGRANLALLETYDPERIEFARGLIQSTDRAFQGLVGRNLGSELARSVFPHVAPWFFGFAAVRKGAFRLISQTRINYHDSALSVGSAGDVLGGDRLPWVASVDNFAPLSSLDWQIHVYGQTEVDLSGMGITVHGFAWNDDAEASGLMQDALYLVRPDGYVAVAQPEANPAELADFLDQFEIKTRA
jgi:2-polyprenyl-6-methoxyphenol hydroxylase-like FAD-dependent oxidoreductase